jgi:hypothetical protein
MIYEYGEPWWNDIDRENQINWRETCPIATLSTTDPTWTDLGTDVDLRSDRLATHLLSHGMLSCKYIDIKCT